MLSRYEFGALVAALLLAGCDDPNLGESPPSMQVGVSRIEFGAVPVGSTASRRIEIQNTGKGDLRLVEPSFKDNPDGVFHVPEYDTPIVPGGKGWLTVAFSPDDEKRYESHLVIEGNDPDNRSAEVWLGGDGFRVGIIEVEPLIVDFGTVNSGSAGVRKVFIRSVGNGDLIVTGIELTPYTSPDFQILSSTQTPATLPTGTEVPIKLVYRPGQGSYQPDEGRLLISSSDPLQPEVPVALVARINQCPVADAGPDRDVDAMETVILDGSLSSDPDGDLPLAFAWSLTRKPEGSDAALSDEETQHPSFTPDLVGVYEAELYVTDSIGCTSLLPDRVVVTALPAEKLVVELVWDSPIADLDLHLLAPGGTLGGPLDCFYDNPAPDWGETGDQADDPWLKRDDLMGFGPEITAYDEPLEGTYQLVVHYFSTHTASGQESTSATLRVFINGLLDAEIARDLESQGQVWTAVEVLWPEGTVTQVDLLE